MDNKLGFTFYPKDWWTSESYFELTAIQRYYYLECLFIMYSNDGYMKTQKTQFENRIRTQVLDEDWNMVVSKFILDKDQYTHNSVNKRLRKAISNRGNGKLGGRPPKEEKPKKPKTETQNNPPLESEGEREDESKIEIPNSDDAVTRATQFDEFGIKELAEKLYTSNELGEQREGIMMKHRISNIKLLKFMLVKFNEHKRSINELTSTSSEYGRHFNNWLNKIDLEAYKGEYQKLIIEKKPSINETYGN